MAINFFGAAGNTITHSLQIGLTFLVILVVAVAIDWCIRRCHNHDVSPRLIKIFHGAAHGLVVFDLVFIMIDIGEAIGQRVQGLFV